MADYCRVYGAIHFTSPAGWLPVHRDQLRAQRSVYNEYGKTFLTFSILPVVPTECDVLIVCRQHIDKERKFKEQHAKMSGNIAGGEKILSPPWFQHYGGERPRRPRRSDASGKV